MAFLIWQVKNGLFSKFFLKKFSLSLTIKGKIDIIGVIESILSTEIKGGTVCLLEDSLNLNN